MNQSMATITIVEYYGEIVSEEAEIILRIYSDFVSGKSASAIAKELTREGIPTPAKKAVWHTRTVESILTKPQIREMFLEMFAIYFADRKATLDTLRYVQKTLTDTDFIDEDIADSEREMDLLTEMIRQTVMQNASATVAEDEYRRRYNDLTDRFRTKEEKHRRLTERRKRMVAESIAIGVMLSELTELEAPPIEFDEKLWHAVVDRVTVYNDDRLVYSLKDGSEITVML